MSGIIKYRFRGEEITIAKAAELAGVEPNTISTRLRENGGDMELAILAGSRVKQKLPEYEPDVRKQKAKQISPEASRQLRIINKLLDALEDARHLRYDDIALKSNVQCLREDIKRMRERMTEPK